MNLLSRETIISLLKDNRELINDSDGFFQKNFDESYTKESHIQQCSVDLHIGEIYIPETKNDVRGGRENPITDGYTLRRAQTALIRTKEKIKLPNNLAGLCFAPSWITLQGMLITNMGHVDPGYEGHLHFTVINMAKDEFILKHKDIICSFLLIELNEKTPPWGKEEFFPGQVNPQIKVPKLVRNSLPKLSKDFIDFESRSRSIANEEAVKEARKVKNFISSSIPIALTIIVTIILMLQYYVGKPWEDEFKAFETRLINIESPGEPLGKEINLLKIRLSKMESEHKYVKKLDELDQIKVKINELERIMKMKNNP